MGKFMSDEGWVVYVGNGSGSDTIEHLRLYITRQ